MGGAKRPRGRSEARHFSQRDLSKITQEETLRHAAAGRLSWDTASGDPKAGNQALVLGSRLPLTLAPPRFSSAHPSSNPLSLTTSASGSCAPTVPKAFKRHPRLCPGVTPVLCNSHPQ